MADAARQVSMWPARTTAAGLAFCLLVAAAAYGSNLYAYNRISALLWALLYSIAIVNLAPLPRAFAPGVQYAASTLLRMAVALLGLTISALAWVQMGVVGLAVVLLVIAFALATGLALGRALGLDARLATLIAAGTGICGATAIAATGPAIDAEEDEIGMAVACVTLFGLVAMVLYPVLFEQTVVGAWLHHSQDAAGVWCGTGIHETSQVVGAAAQIGDEALAVGLAAKSVRIFSIAPVVVLLASVFRRGGHAARSGRAAVPAFAICFVLFTLVNSTLLAWPATGAVWGPFVKGWLQPAVTFLLAVAFAGVGAKIQVRSFARLGLRAFVVGLTVSALTALVALALVVFVYMPARGM